MRRYLGLFWAFLLQRVKIQLEYRVDFALGLLFAALFQASEVAAVWAVMRHAPQINGWSFEQILLIQGLLTIALGVSLFFSGNLWSFHRYIRFGGLDRYLVRPINPLFHLLVSDFNLSQVSQAALGVGFVAYAAAALGIDWTPLRLLYVTLAALSGAAIFAGTYLLTATASFWIVNSHPLTFVVFKTFELVKFPLTVYPRVLRVIMTWVIPYALASFYPASYLLGQDVGVAAWAGPVVAAVMLFAGYRLWQVGLRRHASTGS